jgi:hypothetical protein
MYLTVLMGIQKINPKAQCTVTTETGLVDDLDNAVIEWLDGTTPISKADIKIAMDELQAEYDALDYARKRRREYPSIQELVVALYDTDDKAAIDAKRAEIKLKYSKP